MDRRKYERTEVDPIEIVIEEIEAGKGTYTNVAVFIEEVSLMGIKFKAAVEFEVNEIVSFRLPSLEMMSLVNGRIVWRHAAEGGYVYGLEVFGRDSQ
jgi:hypothetical protein